MLECCWTPIDEKVGTWFCFFHPFFPLCSALHYTELAPNWHRFPLISINLALPISINGPQVIVSTLAQHTRVQFPGFSFLLHSLSLSLSLPQGEGSWLATIGGAPWIYQSHSSHTRFVQLQLGVWRGPDLHVQKKRIKCRIFDDFFSFVTRYSFVGRNRDSEVSLCFVFN